MTTPAHSLVKFNPLANWTYAQVERDLDSEGYALATAYEVSAAPFFIVVADDGAIQVYTAFHHFISVVFYSQSLRS